MTTNDSDTGFLINDKVSGDRRSLYHDRNSWHPSVSDCSHPFATMCEAADWAMRFLPTCVSLGRIVVVDLAGKQVWPDASTATDSTEVESLRKQVADLTAEVARLKDQRRERIATAALQGLLACNERSGSFDWYATDAIAFADALIAKIDGKEN